MKQENYLSVLDWRDIVILKVFCNNSEVPKLMNKRVSVKKLEKIIEKNRVFKKFYSEYLFYLFPRKFLNSIYERLEEIGILERINGKFVFTEYAEIIRKRICEEFEKYKEKPVNSSIYIFIELERNKHFY
ncbi:MAG: hypothetical protein B6U78_01445 [Candidatus Aenigmarchaeota archaeon ex4484_224]|nr:MAG: hypothetical protein B6U78_01445 [Candidatus Aenigmarchaeota archaeon ex4484_224]